MALLNGKRDLKVILEHNGCVVRELTTVIPTYSAARRTIRELMKMGYKFEDLAVLDVETGRLLSWIQ